MASFSTSRAATISVLRPGSEGSGGRYRKRLKTFTKAMLSGFLGYRGERGYPQAHEVFAQIFGLEDEEDWQRLQGEFDEYLEAKLYEIKPSR